MDTSFLSKQVNSIVGQLHAVFDDIGVPGHERDARESELFSALSETLNNHLKIVNNEKNEMAEEAKRLVKSIKQMQASLNGSQQANGYDSDDDDLKVTYPLVRCLKSLKERYNSVGRMHRERVDQVKKLVQALESYASHLEPSFLKIKLPPSAPDAPVSPSFDVSPGYVNSLDNEFTRVYEEYTRRHAIVKALGEEIIQLWAELGTPQAQTDAAIIEFTRDAPEQLGLHQDDLNRLRARKEKLVEEKRGRERRLKELRATIESLWDRLGIEEHERKGFLMSNRGCGLRSINEFEDELARLNELKRQNMHLFVEEARCRLQELWDILYFSEEEMLEFTPAFSDVYSDALLSAHEAEINRLDALKEQRLPILQSVEKHRTLVKERDDLQASSQDASRLMGRGNKGEKRDPTRLLREEKMRKRIAKELPKVEVDLRKILERWEDEYGRPFLVHGERYLDELEAAAAAAAASKAPARAKTPSAPPQATAKSAQKSAPPSRNGTVRGAPPPRSKTPVGNGTLGRSVYGHNPLASSVSSNSLRSPSKIPARPPLSNMPHGNNSPERRPRPAVGDKGDTTIRKGMGGGMGASMRAPPPKMQDLFIPPQSNTPMSRSGSVQDMRSGSIVRQIAPEDPYDDRYNSMPPPTFSASTMRSTQHPHGQYTYAPPPRPISAMSAFSNSNSVVEYPRPGSRQISNTSSTSNSSGAVSGSENWETYDDASEAGDETDAREAYYAKVRAAMGKRGPPVDGAYTTVQGKKVRGLGIGMTGNPIVEEEVGGELVRVEGSEAGWTDEDGF